MSHQPSHNIVVGYLTWIFGFIGAHRFYYGRPLSGTLYFFTLGLLGIGWLVDLFLLPSMDREADLRFVTGDIDYSITWLLLVFLGLLGIHRFYMGKIFTGILYLCTAGLFGLGYIYDLWTMNDQVSLINAEALDRASARSRTW